MSFDTLKKEIIDKELCTCCAACKLVCPQDAIRFEPDTLLPYIESDTCESCNSCLTACAGKDPCTKESERILFGKNRTGKNRWLGLAKKIVYARAEAERIHENSASGGCVTAFLIAAMKKFNLAAVITAGRNEQRPWRNEPVVCRTAEECLANAQSVYQLSNHLAPLKELLKNRERIGLVGLPCHIQAVRKLQSLASETGKCVQESVRFMIELACSSSTLPAGTEEFIRQAAHVALEEVQSLQYRQGKYPGAFTLVLKDGRSLRLPFWQMVEFFRPYKTFRCLSCGDWMSGLADISVCDGDSNVYQSSLENRTSAEKCGRIFIRTNTGMELYNYARQNNLLKILGHNIMPYRSNLGLNLKKNRREYYLTTCLEIPAGPMDEAGNSK